MRCLAAPSIRRLHHRGYRALAGPHVQVSADTIEWAAMALAGLAAVGAVGLIGAALVQIARAVHLRAGARTNWVLAVVCAPLFGAIAWFAIGNRLDTE
ncbi:hypothetical protein E3O48_02505 [Cryobacterium sp. HLT2-28]|nr:hypothetical protein E3O48_02505 [Cryobacterium sp. HLT2-28]